jgi:FKBP-type peptidyl-prolyl cis-trans isomerase FklB
MDKISYALGLSVGHNLLGSGVKEINAEDFARALKAVVSQEKFEMTIEEAQKVINTFFEKLERKKYEKNIADGKAFLEANAKIPGVVTLPSGLQYCILQEGKGEKPSETDTVNCHYHGTLMDGTVFDSSVQRGTPASFGVNQVIQGWVEALQLMPVGSKWRLFIPSELAYGAQGAGQLIGPHTTLIFDVELLGIDK